MANSYYDGRFADIDRKANLILDAQLEESRRRVKAMRRADSLDEEEARSKMRRDAERCRQHQERFDAAFAKFGRRAPEPAADAHPPDYRRRLYAIGQSMLPSSDHPLAKFRPDSIDGSAIAELERQLLEALDRESEEPTGDNVPSEGMREVTKVDSTGLKKTGFYGKRSFINDFARPGRRVLRLMDPRNGRVLLGANWSTPPG
jgi:hypothetical protein